MITIQPFENQDTEQIVDLILNIQQNEFNVPITINEQQDLLNIPTFYQQRKGNFWVAKYEFRGKEFGIAQQLFDILSRAAKQAEMTNIYLGTLERLQAAIRFYERNGFTLIEKENLPKLFPIMAVDTHFFEQKII
jgi:putative acetyltransferase